VTDNIFTIADSLVVGSIDDTILDHPGIRTWIFDPPYNIGYDYGKVITDRREQRYYEIEIREMAANMKFHSKANANLFLVIYPSIAARLLPVIEDVGWSLKQWLTWVYPSNIGHSKKKFTTGSRAVLWFTIGDPEFNHKAVVQPYKEDSKKTRAMKAKGSKGAALYDWWEINLRKNVSKGFKGYFNQLPFKLVENILLHTTQEGEWVGDLTAGAGTTWEVAKEIGRSCWLNDLNPDCLEIWEGI